MATQQPHIVCPKCERFLERSDEAAARQAAEDHNEKWHDNDEVALVIRPTYEDAEELITRAEAVLSSSELDAFRNYVRRNRVMDGFFKWDGQWDEYHDEFEDFQRLDEIMGF